MSRNKKDGKHGGRHKDHYKRSGKFTCIEFRDGTSGCWDHADRCPAYKECVLRNKACKEKFKRKKSVWAADITKQEVLTDLSYVND